MTENVTHKGGCHCGAVEFELDAPADLEVFTCSCSICAATGFVHLIVKDHDFRIISGKDNLTEYRFNSGVAQHLFCKTCGVKAFYVPRSHPDGWSVNATCVEKASVKSMNIGEFDGANWESSIDTIR